MNVKKKKSELFSEDKYAEIMKDINKMHTSSSKQEFDQVWKSTREKWIKYKLRKFLKYFNK